MSQTIWKYLMTKKKTMKEMKNILSKMRKVVKILKVFMTCANNAHESVCKIILNAMQSMHMRNCAKGSITREPRFKILFGQWFAKAEKCAIPTHKEP